MNEKIVEAWNAIKAAVAELDVDVLKNAKGNASAGVRARKGLRALKTSLSDLVKVTLEEGKAKDEE